MNKESKTCAWILKCQSHANGDTPRADGHPSLPQHRGESFPIHKNRLIMLRDRPSVRPVAGPFAGFECGGGGFFYGLGGPNWGSGGGALPGKILVLRCLNPCFFFLVLLVQGDKKVVDFRRSIISAFSYNK